MNSIHESLNDKLQPTTWQEVNIADGRHECFPEESPLEALSTSTSSVQTSTSSSDLSSAGSPVQGRFASDTSDTGVSVGSSSSVAAEEYEGEGETEDLPDVQSASTFPW